MKRIFILIFLNVFAAFLIAQNPVQKRRILSGSQSHASSVSTTYYLRHILPDNGAASPPRMDGASLISFKDTLYLMFGWNPAFTVNQNTNSVWKSADRGLTFTLQSNAPSVSAEQKAVIRADGKVWIWPVKGSTGDSGSVYTFSDNVFSAYIGSVTTLADIKLLHKDRMYSMFGQLATGVTPTAQTNVYQSTNGSTWNVISTTSPSLYLTTGTGWSNGGKIYVCGGAKVTSYTGTYEYLDSLIYVSNDDGLSFSVFAELPDSLRSMWPNACEFDGKIWYLTGYRNGANRPGLWYSENNGVTWTLFTNDIPARHATSMCVHDGCLYIGWGNFYNDLYRVEPIEYPRQGFANTDVQTWWERLWPEDRPGNVLLSDINTLVSGLMQDTSDTEETSNWEELDFFAMAAGLENENQFLIPIKSSKPGFFNSTVKVSTPIFSTTGVSGNTLTSGLYVLDWNPDNNGIKFQLNNASAYSYLMNVSAVDLVEFASSAFYMSYYSDARFFAALNTNVDVLGAAGTNTPGFRGIYRVSSLQVKTVNNTTELTTGNMSSFLDNADITMCGYQSGGDFPSPNTLGFVSFGSGYVSHSKLRTRIRNFYTARSVPH